MMRNLLSILALVYCTATCRVDATLVSSVTVHTRASHNPALKVWYRVPEGYKPVKGRTWRTLVIFGGRIRESYRTQDALQHGAPPRRRLSIRHHAPPSRSSVALHDTRTRRATS